ncbi:MAG: preQ(1) synthase [Candidatus Omnitrophota bacterium]
MLKKSVYEGLQENVRKLKLPAIDTWENKYTDRNYEICLEVPEFTCLCPKTGLPDFACIYVDYVPDKLCLELKSFKEYIYIYRGIGIFHEHVVNRILDDIKKAVMPRSMKITGVFNVRGGIKTTVTAEYAKK